MPELDLPTEELEDPVTERGETLAPWLVASAAVIGAKHVAVDRGSQDAVATYSGQDCAVVAVADGHGDPRHARSDVGSKIACEVALELLRELAEDINGQGRHFKEWERELRLRLPGRISWAWNQRVREHAGHEDPDGAWHEDVDLYGTTLICALLTRRCVVLFQLGDGDLVVVSKAGVRCAFPPSDELFGTATWSLAQADAPTHADLQCCDPRDLSLLLLCTDGIRDAFAKNPEAFLGVGRWLHGRVREEGLYRVEETLPEWLSELSRRGNGDDASIALLKF